MLEGALVSIRSDLSNALDRAHSRLGQTGSWLNGEQRLAVVAEVRESWKCNLCQSRKLEISPYTLSGKHQSLGDLPASWVDVIHRVVTDSGRLSKRWFKEAISAGLLEDEFIEIIILCVQTLAIDIFSTAIGMALPSLPNADKGYPARFRPPEAKIGPGWVATISPDDVRSDFSDFYANESHFYIRRSMTLVKNETRNLWDLLDQLYIEDPRVFELQGLDRGISRAQMEFLAARASSLLGCFY
jgi:hypothetical protein